MKRPPTDWEKIFANDETDKGLIYEIHKEFIQLNIKKAKQLSQIWEEDLNGHFTKEGIQMANSDVKRF